jgi:hypothetical protein
MNKCGRCEKEFNPNIKSFELYKQDGLCGKCRSRQKYLNTVDKYRKNNTCPICGKIILSVSKMCNKCSQLGKRNHQWKDEKVDRVLYSKKEYKIWRKAVLEKSNNKCIICGNTYRLAAHHIYPKRDFPSKTYDVLNGVALCHKCHSKIQLKETSYIEYFLQLIMPNQNSVNSVNPEMGIPNQAL